MLAANKEQYHETKRINLLRARERGGRDGNGVSFVTKPEDKQNTKIKPVKSRRQKSQNTKKRVKALKNLKTLKNEFIPLKNLKT